MIEHNMNKLLSPVQLIEHRTTKNPQKASKQKCSKQAGFLSYAQQCNLGSADTARTYNELSGTKESDKQ